jgi:hypothetical protein
MPMPTVRVFLALALFGFIPMTLHAQDSTKPKKHFVKAYGNIQFTNNGVAPVPIFALGRPAVIANTYIRKGRLYFNNDLMFGLDAKPWTINNRLGYYIVDNEKLSIHLATDLSLFFLQRDPNVNNHEEYQLQRYWGNEVNGEYRFTPNRKLQFSFWHTIAMDDIGIKREEFFTVSYSIENIRLGKNFLYGFRPTALYIYDYQSVEGVYAGQTSTLQYKKWGINAFLQTMWPVHVVPKVPFIWNAGVNIPFGQ